MGLFDKKKKEENLKIEDADVTSSVNDDRRFFVIVDGVTSMLDGNGSIISGSLFGQIKKGDKVFIHQPSMTALECEVQAIEAKADGKSSIVDEAEDGAVALQLSLPDDAVLRKYAVITNLAPQDKVNPNVSIENPALAGIINGMVNYGKDNGFHGTVAYWASHSHFITPIQMDKEPEIDANGNAIIKKDTQIGFYMLKTKLKLTGADDDSESVVLPLFTDWNALRRWEGLMKKETKVHTQILSFQDVYAMLKKSGTYAGLVINPFNQVPCTLPIPYLDTVVNTPGYKNEFGPKEEAGDGKVREEKIPAGKRILLGVPKESEETTAVREKLAEYGSSHDEIASMSLLTKIEEDTKSVRHLVVLEFEGELTPDEMKSHMEAIYQQLNPIVTEIKQIEYAIKGRIQAIDDVVAQHADQMVVYSK